MGERTARQRILSLPNYKLLFAHARMVEDLLRGFIHEAWVREVDFATLERVSGSYVSDDLRDREDDMIWRVRWGADWLYIYLLLEFQATVDRYMAVRLIVCGVPSPSGSDGCCCQRGCRRRHSQPCMT